MVTSDPGLCFATPGIKGRWVVRMAVRERHTLQCAGVQGLDPYERWKIEGATSSCPREAAASAVPTGCGRPWLCRIEVREALCLLVWCSAGR